MAQKDLARHRIFILKFYGFCLLHVETST